MRHGDIIPWDDGDIDIGILDAEVPRVRAAFVTIYKLCGHWGIHRSDWFNPGCTAFGVRRSSFRMFWDLTTPWYIDVADYERISDVRDTGDRLLADTHYSPLLLVINESDVLPTVPCRFGRLTLPCPRNTDLYLTRLYGDWRTPRKGMNANPDNNRYMSEVNQTSVGF